MLASDHFLYCVSHVEELTMVKYSGRKHISSQVKWQLAKKQGFKCALSGEELEEVFDVDHIVPLANGGTDTFNNLQLLNLTAHRIKTSMEAVARNKKKDSLHCSICNVDFSKYFLKSHLHLRKSCVVTSSSTSASCQKRSSREMQRLQK